jgi:hypothetical protein
MPITKSRAFVHTARAYSARSHATVGAPPLLPRSALGTAAPPIREAARFSHGAATGKVMP